MQIYLSHSGNYDYEMELYAPLKKSDLIHNHKILFPHDTENINTKSRDLIARGQLVIAEVSYPSTGQGIELGWADSAGTPILCMYRTGSQISSSLRFVAKDFVEYDDQSDMVRKLKAWLAKDSD